jgi:hypothetical protein
VDVPEGRLLKQALLAGSALARRYSSQRLRRRIQEGNLLAR